MASSSAAFDRRRINGPETFAAPSSTLTPPASSSSSSSSERDRAARGHVRPLFVQTGLVGQASGSAYVESGTAKVACAVYGPRQSQATRTAAGAEASARSYTNEAELNVDVRFASFATAKRKRAGKDTESASLASVVRLALLPSIRLDKLPKATIDVYVTILEADAGRGAVDEDDEACAAVAATAASCALADAGIELYALVVGVHGVYRSSSEEGDKGTAEGDEDEFVIDATHAEARRAHASLMLCSMPALGTVTWMEQSGMMKVDQVTMAMGALQTAAATVHLTAAKAIQDGYTARKQVE